MIKENKVEIKVSSATYKKYYEKYGPYNSGDLIIINIEDLTKNSRIKITAICEICEVENMVYYQNYNIQKNRGGYYCCKNCSINKNKATNLEKYGFEFALQNNDVKEKRKNTTLFKYGVDNISKMDDIKRDRSEKMKSESYQKKLKKGVMDKYDTDNVSKLEHIKEKKKKTCLTNYGVENPTQSPDIFEKSQKNGKNIKLHKCGLYYRGTYEKHFLDMCYDNNIEVEKGPTKKYLLNNKIKYYHSDFYIKKLDLICEIKSSYYYYKFLEVNIQKKKYSEMEHNFLFIIDKNYTELFSFFIDK